MQVSSSDFRYDIVKEFSGQPVNFPHNLVKFKFLQMWAWRAAFSCLFRFFLFYSPLFLGDRESIKFQDESAWKLQKIGEFAWKIVKQTLKFVNLLAAMFRCSRKCLQFRIRHWSLRQLWSHQCRRTRWLPSLPLSLLFPRSLFHRLRSEAWAYVLRTHYVVLVCRVSIRFPCHFLYVTFFIYRYVLFLIFSLQISYKIRQQNFPNFYFEWF